MLKNYQDSEKPKLTRKAKSMIREVIEGLPEEKRFNQCSIVEAIGQQLDKKYMKRVAEDEDETKQMDYQLGRLKMKGTKAIISQVDAYLVSHTDLKTGQ
ncbi:MAG: hypothetical protein RSC93_11030 [Erysipelotrichaceae bacterium]